MTKSSTRTARKNPSAWARGPPQTATATSPHSQAPAPSTPIHQTHSRRPSTVGQGISIKHGVSVQRNNIGVVKQGSAVTFGSIDDVSAPIPSSPVAGPAVKSEGVKSFGSVPATATPTTQNGPSGDVNGKASIDIKKMFENKASISTPIQPPGTPTLSHAHTLPNPAYIPHPPPALSHGSNSIGGLTSPPPTPSSASTLAAFRAFVLREKVILKLKRGDGTEVNLANIAKSTPAPAAPATTAPPQGSVYRQGSPGTPKLNRRPAVRLESQDQRKARLAEEEAREKEQFRVMLLAEGLARAASVPTSSAKAKKRARAAALAMATTLEAEQRRARADGDGKADEAQEDGKTAGASAPPSLVQVASGLARLNAGSNAFVPRQKVTLKKEDGTEVNLDNIAKSTLAPTAAPQGFMYRQGSPGRPNRRPASVRIESEDQRKARLAEEEAREKEQLRMKLQAEEKIRKAKEGLAAAASVPTSSAQLENRAHAAVLAKLITLEAEQSRARAEEDGKADEAQEDGKTAGASAPPSLVQVASGLVAPQYPVNSQLPGVSLAAFCRHYEVSLTDQERLEKLEFQPGDAIDTLPEDDWKVIAGFATLSWRRIIAKNNYFICDAQNGLWG